MAIPRQDAGFDGSSSTEGEWETARCGSICGPCVCGFMRTDHNRCRGTLTYAQFISVQEGWSLCFVIVRLKRESRETAELREWWPSFLIFWGGQFSWSWAAYRCKDDAPSGYLSWAPPPSTRFPNKSDRHNTTHIGANFDSSWWPTVRQSDWHFLMARCKLWWFSVRLTTCNSLLTGKFSYGLEVNYGSTYWKFF